MLLVLCVSGALSGCSPVLAALDQLFVPSRDAFHPPVTVEYLSGLTTGVTAKMGTRDSDDVTSVGILESGGKENTVSALVRDLSRYNMTIFARMRCSSETARLPVM